MKPIDESKPYWEYPASSPMPVVVPNHALAVKILAAKVIEFANQNTVPEVQHDPSHILEALQLACAWVEDQMKRNLIVQNPRIP